MISKRLRKKRAKQAAELALRPPLDRSELTEAVVTVPCPDCAHPTMRRRFLPAAGTMNGSVACPRCRFEGAYVEVLARAMSTDDPVPEAIVLPAPRRLTIDLFAQPRGFARVLHSLNSTQRVFASIFGIKRRWRFATS